MRTSVGFWLAACVAAGCGSSNNPPFVVPPFNPPSPAGAQAYDIAVSTTPTTLVDANAFPGFGITVASSGVWRLEWIGNKTFDYDDFRGYVYTPGTFTASWPGCQDHSCALEAGDTMSDPTDFAAGGQMITFDTTALDGLDGLDFTVSVDTFAQPITFYLETQYMAQPLQVYFTNKSDGFVVSPPGLPFALTTEITP